MNLPLYQKIFRSTFFHSSVRACFSTITALVAIFVVRMMGPGEFGKFSLVLQLAVTFGLFLSWGSSGMLAKFLPEKSSHESQAKLSSQAMEVSVLSVLVFAVLFLLLCQFYPSIFPIEIRSAKFLFVFFVSLFAVFNVLQGIFRGIGKFVQWSFIEGLNDFLARVFTLLLLLIVSVKYEVALYCFSGILFLLTFYAFFAVRDQFRRVDMKVESEVARFSMVVLIGAVVFMVGTSADAVLLRALLKDPTEVGYYFAGVRIPQTFQGLLLAPLSIPFVYYFTHPDTLHTRDRIMKLGTKLLGVACGIASLALFSFGKFVILLLYGKSFLGSINVLRIYSLILFLVGMQSFFGPFFMAINKLHVQVFVGVFSVLLLIGLDFLFIPRWASSGSALANVVMLGVQTMVFVYILLRYQMDIVKIYFLLMIGMLLSITLELFWIPYSSIPFFLLFLFVSRMFSADEIRKIRLVIFSKGAEALP